MIRSSSAREFSEKFKTPQQGSAKSLPFKTAHLVALQQTDLCKKTDFNRLNSPDNSLKSVKSYQKNTTMISPSLPF